MDTIDARLVDMNRVAAEQGWLLVNQAFPELERDASAEAARIFGETAVRGLVEVVPVDEADNESTLMTAIQLARLGDSESRQVVETNVVSDIAERMFKAGHQSQVMLEMVDGTIMQNGRALVDVSRNSLTHLILNSEMMTRTQHELKNALLFQSLATAGLLETHNAVVFSPAPTDQQTKEDYGFYGDTDTCSVQMLSKDDDQLLLETALVAGKKTPESSRHDIGAIHTMAAENGIELIPDSAADMIKYVMLVPKSSFERGISDVVQLYDQAVGGVFYGEAKPTQDYQEYAQICQARNESFSDMVQQITNQLLAEATAFATPFEAIQRLDELSERVCVQYAISAPDVCALVFGIESAHYIEQARILHDMGDVEGADKAMRIAQDTANSSSCPLFQGSSKEEGGPDNAGEESKGKKWMSCPHCSAKVYDDPCAKVLSCWDCKATVVHGVVLSSGNGGSKKRREDEKARQYELIAQQVDEAFEESDSELLEESKIPSSQSAGKVALAGV